jgi:hypothetical protein
VSGIRFSRLPIGPDLGAAPAARLAGKSRLKIRQAEVIRPSVAADRGPMRAVIIAAIDQQPTNPGGAHFG